MFIPSTQIQTESNSINITDTILPPYADPYGQFTFSKIINNEKRVLVHKGTRLNNMGYEILFEDPISKQEFKYTDKNISLELTLENNAPLKYNIDYGEKEFIIPAEVRDQIKKESLKEKIDDSLNKKSNSTDTPSVTQLVSSNSKFTDIIEKSKKQPMDFLFTLNTPRIEFLKLMLDNLELTLDEEQEFINELKNYIFRENLKIIESSLNNHITQLCHDNFNSFEQPNVEETLKRNEHENLYNN